ncbi:MAG: hypothetical protein LBP59_05440 [Planctomycetaceae bacterium]|nr:hypothetical protein [Planctomycetaceae bacterium]
MADIVLNCSQFNFRQLFTEIFLANYVLENHLQMALLYANACRPDGAKI